MYVCLFSLGSVNVWLSFSSQCKVPVAFKLAVTTAPSSLSTSQVLDLPLFSDGSLPSFYSPCEHVVDRLEKQSFKGTILRGLLSGAESKSLRSSSTRLAEQAGAQRTLSLFLTRLFTFPQSKSSGQKLRVAVIGGGLAGSSAAKSEGGVETFLFERSPAAAKPCGGAISVCMLDEFDIPSHLFDRKVTHMKITYPSNLTVDFGKTLKPHEFISMLRREVLDSYLRSRAESNGVVSTKALVTSLEVPSSPHAPYLVDYTVNNSTQKPLQSIASSAQMALLAKSIHAGNYACAIAFQERIKLPDHKMENYNNLAEMYVGNDVSPDFYAWVFPKCDHVAVGTGTLSSKHDIKLLWSGIRRESCPR
ncbi:hypothetical protein RJ639_030688 [Escallonia herrerae]|uniref:Digeranylgeranylglycerophospholipid reductase catalytic domain-containing protein n=1 Tax=Escallonia herrerae TaxID=1293975 RepID=A0AA89BC09_9ASTE|nr:hypothetical protein RJ639_030688 [Escallonia herrerae]